MLNNKKVKKLLGVLLAVIGTILVAFGNMVFLEPFNINAGGLNGIGLIFEQLSNDAEKQLLIYNIITYSLSLVLWVVGLIFIGKTFAILSLVSSIVYPLSIAFFSYVPSVRDGINAIINELQGTIGEGGEIEIGRLLLSGVFGGVIIGAGVAITFVSGGSTGGVDTITIILEKFAHLKQSIGSFIVDGFIILIGLFVLKLGYVEECLCGVISAFLSALLIDFIFVRFTKNYQVDIISDQWQEISRFAQDELGRGATIIPCQGGYKGQDRVILRVVFDTKQYLRIRKYIAKVDPKAFITFTVTNAVYGEGFKLNKHKKAKDEQ